MQRQGDIDAAGLHMRGDDNLWGIYSVKNRLIPCSFPFNKAAQLLKRCGIDAHYTLTTFGQFSSYSS